MYGLRKIAKDGTNIYNDFVWPLEVGAEVEAFDWNPKPIYGGGLYCLPNAQGDWTTLNGDDWAVIEFDEKDMVLIGVNKYKVRKCKIVFLSEHPKGKGMDRFFDFEKFDSESAYFWALFIGNQDQLVDRITESEWACYWANFIGNQEQLIARFPEIASRV